MSDSREVEKIKKRNYDLLKITGFFLVGFGLLMLTALSIRLAVSVYASELFGLVILSGAGFFIFFGVLFMIGLDIAFISFAVHHFGSKEIASQIREGAPDSPEHVGDHY